MSRAVLIAYHSISDGPAPLCLPAPVLRAHLDRIADAGATVLTVTELASRQAEGTLPELAVALTFDDGYLDFVETAVPLLVERGMPATVFCVAGWLGRVGDWPTLPARAPRLPLATAFALANARAEGIEIGAHGLDHAPLHDASDEVLERELAEGRRLLSSSVGAEVTSLAYPYGVPPADLGLVRREYRAACAGGTRASSGADDPHLLPRIDAHYLRRPALLGAVLRGGGPYLALRRAGSRARRRFVRDYAA